MTPLASYAESVAARDARLRALDLAGGRWARELADGLAIDATRARFIVDAYTAVLAHLAGDPAAAKSARDRAAAALDSAKQIVARRHRDLHDPDPGLVTRGDNATTYGYGYLYFADQLCYWQRELDQVDAILGFSDAAPPACVL